MYEAAVPGAPHHGADELHGPRAEGRLRGVDRLAGDGRAQATAAEVTGFPLEKVVVHNHLPGRRVRPPAGARLCNPGGPHREAGRRAGEGGLDPRGGRAARRLPPVLLRPPGGGAGRSGEAGRLDPPGRGPLAPRALGAAGVQGRARRRRGGRERRSYSTTSRRSGSSTCATRSRCSTPAGGAAWESPTTTS